MIVVTVEVWPEGDKARALVVDRMTILNDGTGDAAVGNYNIERLHPIQKYAFRKGRVERHDRRLRVWELVRRALEVTEMDGDRTDPVLSTRFKKK